MEYRQLGKTGISVSVIGFGGEWLERHEESESVDLIRYAGEQSVCGSGCRSYEENRRTV